MRRVTRRRVPAIVVKRAQKEAFAVARKILGECQYHIDEDVPLRMRRTKHDFIARHQSPLYPNLLVRAVRGGHIEVRPRTKNTHFWKVMDELRTLHPGRFRIVKVIPKSFLDYV